MTTTYVIAGLLCLLLLNSPADVAVPDKSLSDDTAEVDGANVTSLCEDD